MNSICINEQLQAENAELKIQVNALTQALETQKRENQPYIKELESKLVSAELIIEAVVINNEANPDGITPDIIEKARDFIAGSKDIKRPTNYFECRVCHQKSAIITDYAQYEIIGTSTTYSCTMCGKQYTILATKATGGDKPEQEP